MAYIHLKEYPNFIRFGKIHISPRKLSDKNILAIKNDKNKNFVGIREMKVSDPLASVVMKIVDGGSIKKGDLHALSQSDKQIFDNLLMISGLHKMHDNTFEESAKMMKERIKLIFGEVESGNNNPELLREAHKLLHSAARCGLISNNAAASHYKALLSFFK